VNGGFNQIRIQIMAFHLWVHHLPKVCQKQEQQHLALVQALECIVVDMAANFARTGIVLDRRSFRAQPPWWRMRCHRENISELHRGGTGFSNSQARCHLVEVYIVSRARLKARPWAHIAIASGRVTTLVFEPTTQSAPQSTGRALPAGSSGAPLKRAELLPPGTQVWAYGLILDNS